MSLNDIIHPIVFLHVFLLIFFIITVYGLINFSILQYPIIFVTQFIFRNNQLCNYTCIENTNSLSKCNNDCCSLNTPCFDYRTIKNQSYCAPASRCSILESCDRNTGECRSNTSVCIVNSCCTPKTVCLPLSWTSLCPSISKLYVIKYIYIRIKKVSQLTYQILIT